MSELPRASDLQLLRELARTFVERELIPLEDRYRDREYLPDDVLAEVAAKARSVGLWAIDVPEEDGGAGLGVLANVIVSEELAQSVVQAVRNPPVGGTAGILLSCSPEQRPRYLEPVVRGERHTAFALTESDSGSDAFGHMRTRAERDGDEWVINGSKLFISHAAKADFVQVMAVTEPGRPPGITCFLVDKGTPGFRVARQLDLMIPEGPCELVFDNCRVPQSQVLGEVGQGIQLAGRWLSHNRIYHSAKCLGRAMRAMEIASDFIKTRKSFGKPLSERQAIQFMIADSVMELHSARMVLYHAAARLDAGENISDEAPIVKVLCNEAAYKASDRCLQMLGGMGLSKEVPLEQIFRELRSMRITEGTTEIHRWRIARNLLKDGRWPDVSHIATGADFLAQG